MEGTHIAYNRHEPKPEGSGQFSVGMLNALDANAKYAEHFGAGLILGFIIKRGNVQQKCKASQELELCETKMKYWSHRPNFDLSKAIRMCSETRVRVREQLRQRGIAL